VCLRGLEKGKAVGAVIKGLFRAVLFVVVMAVLVISLTTAWTAWRFRASIPELEGQLQVAGLNGPVIIARDEYGVPHIFGETEEDVFFGLGYAHAQDRKSVV